MKSFWKRILPETFQPPGDWKRISPSRSNVRDLLRASLKVPSQSIFRMANVKVLSDLRQQAAPRISWPVLFLKALASVTTATPALRHVYVSCPWPHIHEHPYCIVRMTASREYEGEEWVFFIRIARPEEQSLVQLQETINDAKQTPVVDHPQFRKQVFIARLPTLIRRVMWWWMLNVSGNFRCLVNGTAGMTTISAQGATSIHPPSVGTLIMTFGPVDDDGSVRLGLVYDHRLHDGAFIARALGALEETLNGSVTDELRSLVSTASGGR